MNRPPMPDVSLVTDPGFLALKRRIVERTGHAYYADKDDILIQRLRTRLEATGTPGFQAYLDRLEADGSGAEWDALISAVMIGETFFFRFREQFAALSSTILPDLIGRRAQDRRLRIWSAGCSNGAEAYSLAIVLSDLIGDEIADWRISIVGTDIDEAALQRARSGVFGAWSLRAVGEDGRRTWFDPGPRPTTFAVKKRYRPLVRFERHNLLSLLDGTSPLQFTDFDVILCRNVLIYFDTETVIRLVTALGGALRPEGWLLLGHAETNPAFTASLVPVEISGATVYRRPGPHLTGPSPSRSPAPAAPSGSSTPAVPGRSAAPGPTAPAAPKAAAEARPRARAERAFGAQAGGATAGATDGDPVGALRGHADRGDLAGALTICRQAQAARPTDPVPRFYEGLIQRALGEGHAAAAALRRAIYLDRDFALAHYHLGLVLLAQGDRTGGRRAVANAGRLAAALPRETLLAEGDGLSAGDLVSVARLVLTKGDPP